MANFAEITSKNSIPKNVIKRINGIPVEIKGCVDVNDFKNIVNTIVKVCFDKEGYRAENREIARRFVVLKYMTDIEVLEDDINEIFKATQGGVWYGEIEREIIKLPVWSEIELAIDKQIDYLILTRETSFDKLCSDLSEVLSKDMEANIADLKEVIDGLNKVDKEAFVKEVVKQNLTKNKGGESNGKKSKRTVNKTGGDTN